LAVATNPPADLNIWKLINTPL